MAKKELAAVLKGVGTGLQVGAELGAGSLAAARGDIQKTLSDFSAEQAIAIGQRKSFESKRQAKLIASRAIAVAAAGGAAQDIDNLIADIEGEGAYRASLAMYEAETQAESIKLKGLMAEQMGRIRKKGSRMGALSTIISRGASLYGANKGPAQWGGSNVPSIEDF